MSAVILFEAVEAFSSSFKSVDLRIVAVKPEDQWINVITSIFLSSKSKEETNVQQQQARDKLPQNTDKFCVLLTCYLFKSLPTLFKQIQKGKITANRIPIKFREFDPSELRVDQFLPSYLKEMEEWRLVGSEAQGKEEDRRNLWPIVNSQNGAARLRGYKDIYELIMETLRIADFHNGRPRDFVFGIPMPARIAEVSLVDSSVIIKTKKVFGLEGLQLNLSNRRINKVTGNYEPIWRKTELVKECKYSPPSEVCQATNSIELTNSRPHDRIEVDLINRQVPTLSIDMTFLMVPLKNAVEPFAKTLNDFCSLEVFKERLLNPERCVEDGTKPNIIFENAVSWLLSLLGLSILPLGRHFERLKIPKTSYEVGSVDIIAYRENECLLLIDCDTSIPDDKKIRSMKAVRDHFKFIQDEFRRPDIGSIIFSPKDCTGIQTGSSNVKIVDRHQITWILEKVMEGKSGDARTSLV
jgi:hypothetical protein